MKILFPKLDGLVNKDAKSNDDDIRKYIHVIGGNAIVINKSFVVVRLRDYIKQECEITEDFETLDNILAFFEGRSFTADYWKEFTVPHEVSLNGDSVTLEGLNYTKTLHNNDAPVVLMNVVDLLIQNLNKKPMALENVAVNFGELSKVTTAFKKELKGLHLNLKFSGQDVPMVFQGEKKDYIFGLIPLDYDAANDMYNFKEIETYVKLLTQKVLD